MDTLTEKFGLYDFFNVFMAGGIVLFYVLLSPLKLYTYLSNSITDEWSRYALLLVAAYLLGIACQQIGSFVAEKVLDIKEKKIREFLKDANKVIENQQKTMVYQKLATQILENAGENVTDNNFDSDQSKYVYSYCVYYIENKNKNKKTEKIRALYGMAKNLIGSSTLVLGSFLIILLYCEKVNAIFVCASLGLSIVLMLLGYKRAHKNMQYLIRMTMAVYEACKTDSKS